MQCELRPKRQELQSTGRLLGLVIWLTVQL